MAGDSSDTIATARQRTRIRQRVRHSDTNGTIAHMGRPQRMSHRVHRRPQRMSHRMRGRPPRISPPHAATVALVETYEPGLLRRKKCLRWQSIRSYTC
jgi:hypothetical protein